MFLGALWWPREKQLLSSLMPWPALPTLYIFRHTYQFLKEAHLQSYLIFLQELKLDGHIIAHLLILVTMDLELQLGLLYLGQGGGITGAQVQLLQVRTVRIILNPGEEGKGQPLTLFEVYSILGDTPVVHQTKM